MGQVIEYGWDELDKKLAELPAKLELRVLKKAIGAGSEVLAQEARQRVHVRTGLTQASIRSIKPRLIGDEVVGGVTVLRSSKVHGWWIPEFGTRFMAPIMFLRPAGLAAGKRAVDAVVDVIRAEVQRLWRE